MTENEFVALAKITGAEIDIAWDETNQEWSGILVFATGQFNTATHKTRAAVVSELKMFWEWARR